MDKTNIDPVKIPEIIKEYEKQWSIKVLAPFVSFYNYAAPAVLSDGTQAVFKIALQGKEQFRAEYLTLRFFNGNGIIRILNVDVENTVLLLEKADPGVPVSSLDDDTATEVIISVMKKLWKPTAPPDKSVTLRDWFAGFERLRKLFGGTTGPLPENIVREGEQLYKYLLDTSLDNVLLHGDLHHDNVLSSTREPWLAIDPDGVVGERAHETAAMLRNPEKLMKQPNLSTILSRRISLLSEGLEIDEERIKQWGIAQSVLAAIWDVEDGRNGWNYSLTIAKTISGLKL